MLLVAALAVIPLAPWPDPFEAGFARRVPKAGAAEEIEFRPAPARGWVDAVRRMGEEAPAKQQYVMFLKEVYGYDVNRLNAAYGLAAGSFTELLTLDWTKLDREREAVKRDDGEFLQVLVKAAADAARQKR